MLKPICARRPSPLMPALATGAAAIALMAGMVANGHAAAVGKAVSLTPHRAVYEITLDRAGPASGVGQLKGRLVYEITGSPCEGYTQNMRFVTRMVSPDGATSLNDMRSSSWEEGTGRRFRFNSSQYLDDKLTDEVAGDASRKSGKVKVELSQPRKHGMDLSSKVYFPVQHSVALLQAAHSGKALFRADLYDGTEKGEKVYSTTAIIGPPLPRSADSKLPPAKNGSSLSAMKAWPVSISYFEPDSDLEDAVPVYELAFRFYANGVSRRLFIDYGDFAVRGALTEITYLEPSKCGLVP